MKDYRERPKRLVFAFLAGLAAAASLTPQAEGYMVQLFTQAALGAGGDWN
jgi:hypothetical protein